MGRRPKSRETKRAAPALNQRERAAYLDAIIDQMPSGVLVIDREQRVRLRNAAGRRIVGLQERSGAPVTTLPGYEAVDPRTGRVLDELTNPLSAALAGKRIDNFQYVLRRPGGLPDATIMASCRPLVDADGAVTGTVMVYSDVTREQELAAEVAAREAHLRSIYDNMACGVIIRRRSGDLLLANRAACRLMGVATAEELAAKFRTLRLLGSDGQLLPDSEWAVAKVIRTGQALHNAVQGVVHPDGRTLWHRFDAAPLLGKDGTVQEVILSFVDITEQKRAEDGRRESEERYRARGLQQAVVADLGQLALKADVQEVLDRATAQVKETLDVTCAAVGELLAGGRSMIIRADKGWMRRNDQPIALNSAFATARAVEINGPVFVEDYREQTEFIPPPAIVYPDIRSGLSVPIPVERGVYGVLAAFSTAPRRFTRDDLHFVEAIANVLGSALDRSHSREALAESERRYRQIVETAQEAIWTVDADGTITLANQKAAELFARSLDRLLGASIFDLTPPGRQEEVRASLERRRQGCAETFDWKFARGDGEHWLSLSFSPLFREDGTFAGALAMATDVTDKKRAQEVLVHRTLHDSLTGLPNRMLLHDRVAQAVAGAKREGHAAAVMFIDLDGFKEVNDAFGHHQGDAVLCQVGPRLRSVVRETDTVARLGGDEFAVVLSGIGDVDEATTVAGRMLKAMEPPFSVGHALVEITASIGIALSPQHGEDVVALLQHADVAMYAAKQQKNSYSLFAGQQESTSTNRLVLAAELRQAIEHDGLQLVFQPKVLLPTGRLIGVEALVRWPHPLRGMLLPDEFVPAAETTGLIRPLSQWVMETALRQLRRWRDADVQITVAVNLSMRDLRDPDLSDQIMGLLQAYGIDPTWVNVEITETMIMVDPKQTMEAVRRLHDLGLSLCIDDFGTGYSSLSYLRDLPARQIKIDKSFVMGMLTSEDDAAIVRSVIELAHNLGRVTVAEGVESREILEALTSLGCDVAQGYYIGRPMDAGGFQTWLAESPFGTSCRGRRFRQRSEASSQGIC